MLAVYALLQRTHSFVTSVQMRQSLLYVLFSGPAPRQQVRVLGPGVDEWPWRKSKLVRPMSMANRTWFDK